MSKRPRRVLLGLVIAFVAVAVIPSTALAAGEKIGVSPVGADGTTPALTAGGSPTLNLSASFDKNKTPTGASFDLPPGLLLNLEANPSCLTGTPDFTNDEACDVGSGEIDLNAILSGAKIAATATGSIFLAPPAAGTNDLAVLDVHITSVQTPLGPQDDVIDAPLHVQFNSQTDGLTLAASNLPASITTTTFGVVGLQITGMTASLNPTMNDASGTSQPFIRLPTSCGAATSTLTATYSDSSTASASDSFTPTGCAGLPYSPSTTIAVHTDASDNVSNVLLEWGHQQAADASDKSVRFSLPSSVTPNFQAFSPGDQIGTISLQEPFEPPYFSLWSGQSDNGTVTLGGSAAAPTLKVAFPAPFDLALIGTIDTADNTVTFSDLPDITGLYSLDLTGSNGTPVYTTDCSGGEFTAVSIGQGAQIVTNSTLNGFQGCTPPAPPPATAEAMTVTPADLTAGGSPALTSHLVFNSTEAPAQNVDIDLAPGLLSNIAAGSSCLTGAPQLTTACHVGTVNVYEDLLGSVLIATDDLFLVAPPNPSKDIAGIYVRAAGFEPESVLDVMVDPSTGGLKLDGLALATSVANGALSLPHPEVDLALDGAPFSHLPTGCSPAASSFTVTYSDDPVVQKSASGSFTPTGCANEPFAPSLSGAVVGKGGPGAAEVKLESTQKADEAAGKTIKLSFPSGLTESSGIAGTASVSSPMLVKPLAGKVSESGSTVKVAFPAPFGLTLTGAVFGNTITFSNLPDIRLSDLSLDLTSGFSTDCSAGSVTGAFSGQGGQSHTATARLQVSDCTPASVGSPPPAGSNPPPTGTTPPSATTPPTSHPTSPPPPRNHVKAPKKAKGSGSVRGLASGHPTVSLKLTLPAGQKAKSLTVALPKGLKFAKAAFAKHGKTKVSGLKIVGAKAASVKLKAGKLVIALKKPVHSLSIKASGKLVTASGAVAASKHHKPLTLTVKLSTTKHKTDTVKITLKA